jgi:hypothetical protein
MPTLDHRRSPERWLTLLSRAVFSYVKGCLKREGAASAKPYAAARARSQAVVAKLAAEEIARREPCSPEQCFHSLKRRQRCVEWRAAGKRLNESIDSLGFGCYTHFGQQMLRTVGDSSDPQNIANIDAD